MKTLILVNTLQAVNSAVYSNHCQFWAYLKSHYPKDQFLFFTPHRMSIDTARNLAAKTALEQECDYLMFLDDDVLVEPTTFDSMLAANKDVVMALTYLRSYPFKPMLFTAHATQQNGLVFYEDFEKHINADGLVECEAIGFSCALLRCDVLKRMVPPFFVTGPNNTEDIYFCVEAKKQLGEVSIYTDVKVPTGHLLSPEVITRGTRDHLMTYYKSIEGERKEQSPDREFSYVQECINTLR